MNIGILIPGFSANENDWAIPVYQWFVRELSQYESVRVIPLRYPHTQTPYQIYDADVYPVGATAEARHWRRAKLWWQTYQLLHQLHNDTPFDLLHAIWCDETAAIASWFGKRTGIPTMVTIAGGELVGLRDIHYGLQRSRFSRWVVDQGMRNSHTIIAGCQYIYDLVPQKYQSKTRVIPLGVDTETFSQNDKMPKPNHIVHVGSLSPVKNQELLLLALEQLPDVSLDIIGIEDDENDLHSFAQLLKLQDRVLFLGKIPHLELAQHYNQASCHILPSYHEAFGMVTLEAAACGTPSITTPVGFLPDEPQFGEIVSPYHIDELADAIRKKLQYPPDRQAIRAKVEAKYSIQHMVSAYRELYEELLNNLPPNSRTSRDD